MARFRRKAPRGRVAFLPRRRQAGFGISKLIAGGGAVLLFFLVLVIAVQSIQHYRVSRQLAEYESRIREQEARNRAVDQEIRRLEELSYIETLARKYLGLVKPGETVFQLED